MTQSFVPRRLSAVLFKFRGWMDYVRLFDFYVDNLHNDRGFVIIARRLKSRTKNTRGEEFLDYSVH